MSVFPGQRRVPWEQGAAVPRWIVHKFGLNENVGTSLETVWLAGGLYDWTFAAGVATITSAAGAADAGAKVTIEGLVGGVKTAEEVTLDGSGSAITAATFSRCWRAWTSGGTETTGLVTVTIGGATVATYSVTAQQTEQCIYTIPDGHTGFISAFMPGTGKNDEVTLRVFTRSPSGVFRARDTAMVFAGSPHIAYQAPGYGSWTGIRCEAGTDIDVRAIRTAGTSASASARLHIVVFAGAW